MAHLDLNELKRRPLADLSDLARTQRVDQPTGKPRQQLIFEIMRSLDSSQVVLGSGVLEVLPDGFGFLRDSGGSFLPGPDDIYVSPSQIRRFNLRNGDRISGHVRAPKEGERYFALTRVEEVNSADPDSSRDKASFDNLTPVHPQQRLTLERPGEILGRLLDLFAPIGMGQRALIHAPPGADPVTLLTEISLGLAHNHPDLQVLMCLVDQRPERVTELTASHPAELLSSTFDEAASRHLQVAEMVMDRARRLVEHGQDVVVLMDSMTQLIRAANQVAPSSGRLLPGGLNPAALQRPKRLLGAARATEEGGSLTLIATLSVKTGSELDRSIAESLRKAANSEIHLCPGSPMDRQARVDVGASYTLRADLLLDAQDLAKVGAMRASLSGESEADLQWIARAFSEHSSNRELLDKLSETGQ